MRSVLFALLAGIAATSALAQASSTGAIGAQAGDDPVFEAAEQAMYRRYTTIDTLRLAATMIADPRRLETIDVVGAFGIGTVSATLSEDAFAAALPSGEAALAVRDSDGDLVTIPTGPEAGLGLEDRRICDPAPHVCDTPLPTLRSLQDVPDLYLLAQSPELVPTRPDFRAISGASW